CSFFSHVTALALDHMGPLFDLLSSLVLVVAFLCIFRRPRTMLHAFLLRNTPVLLCVSRETPIVTHRWRPFARLPELAVVPDRSALCGRFSKVSLDIVE